MEQLSQPGGVVFAVDAPFPAEHNAKARECQLGVVPKNLRKHNDRGLSTFIAQFYLVVGDGLINAKHVFRGLERPMYCDDDKHADCSKFIYTWKPTYDACWSGDRFTGSPVQYPAPSHKVFVVIVSPNKMKKQFPNIDGWIEYWNWAVESSTKANAPIDWGTRYKNLLWSR